MDGSSTARFATGAWATQVVTPLLGTKFEILAFIDIVYGAYYYLPVQWMTAEGLTTGVTPDLFAPDQANSRAMIATFLWRFRG